MDGSSLLTLARWATRLRLDDVPARVRESATTQILSTLAAVYSGYDSDPGPQLGRALQPRSSGNAPVLPNGCLCDPADSAALMSAWSIALDYDDVMLGGHTGHSSVLVSLSYAAARRLTGGQMIRAQIIANEIAARVNMTVALGRTRGQMATYVHALAAAAARAAIEDLPDEQFASALAFSLSCPARILYPAFLGSDAKALCIAAPILSGCASVTAARAGLRSHAGVLDEFQREFSPCPLPEFLGSLGRRWHTETNSYKAYPGSAYLQAAVEAAIAAKQQLPDDPDSIARVDVYCPLLTVGMEHLAAPYVQDRDPCVASLSFSARFAVACALLFDTFEPDHLKHAVRTDPAVWKWFARIRLQHDPDLTVAALQSEMPVGAALAAAPRLERLRFLMTSGGHRSSDRIPTPWRDRIALAWKVCKPRASPVPQDSGSMVKALGARVRLTQSTGKWKEAAVAIPAGFAGSGDAATVRNMMRRKYLACAGRVVGDGNAVHAAGLIEEMDTLTARDFREMVYAGIRPETMSASGSLCAAEVHLETQTNPPAGAGGKACSRGASQ